MRLGFSEPTSAIRGGVGECLWLMGKAIRSILNKSVAGRCSWGDTLRCLSFAETGDLLELSEV